MGIPRPKSSLRAAEPRRSGKPAARALGRTPLDRASGRTPLSRASGRTPLGRASGRTPLGRGKALRRQPGCSPQRTVRRAERPSSSSSSFRKAVEVKRLLAVPAVLAAALAVMILASGKLDELMMRRNARRLQPFSETIEEPLQLPAVPVQKAAVDIPLPGSEGKLLFTLHQVGKGETLSRIACNYGLSPVTLMSMNKLEVSEKHSVHTGDTLLIPYRDGIRVTPKSGERHEDLAEFYGVDVSLVQSIPDSDDFFVSGSVEDGIVPLGSGDFFIYPVPGRVIAAYGEMTDSLTGIPYNSQGIDLAAEEGSPVNASRKGRVLLTGHHASYGLYVMMGHPGGWKSFYGHLSKVSVKRGDELEAGESLGLAGSSGSARSPRLHFALFRDTESVDPLDYLN